MTTPPIKGQKFDCEPKHRYADEMTARIGAMHSINRYKNTDKLYVYKCPHCVGWHLTHSVQRDACGVKADDPVAMEDV